MGEKSNLEKHLERYEEAVKLDQQKRDSLTRREYYEWLRGDHHNYATQSSLVSEFSVKEVLRLIWVMNYRVHLLQEELHEQREEIKKLRQAIDED